MNITPITARRWLMLGGAVMLTGMAGLLLDRSASADGPSAAVSNTVTAYTRPSKESKLSFAIPGLVSEIEVKQDDVIKKDQVLASEDSRQAEADYQSAELDATNTDKITYSKADNAYKTVVLARKQKMLKESVASPSEVEEAQDAVNLTDAQLKLAITEHQQNQYKAQQKQLALQQMKMHAPYDGVVEKLNINLGEMADPQNKDGSIVIGQWDPLWVDMPLPSAQAAQLKMGQTLDAKYAGDSDWKPAKIIGFSVVDAASDTQTVRLELPNPGNARYPGLAMQVKLPEKTIAAAANP